MTSLKSSANKHTAKYDFKRSLLTNLGAGVITFITTLFAFVLNPLDEIGYTKMDAMTIKQWVENARSANTMILHTANDPSLCVATPIALFMCGALFAIASFGYIMKKKQVNLYYSAPIDRLTMFKNRTVSALIYMVGSLALTIGFDTAVNIFFFGNPLFIIKNALIMLFISFVYLLLGYSIFAIAMAACPTSVEGFFFGGGLAALPTLLITSFDNLCCVFLNGWGRIQIEEAALNSYVWDYGLMQNNLLTHLANYNPLLFCKKIGNSGISENIYSRVCCEVDPADKALGLKAIESSYIIPAVIWAVIAVALVVLARHLFLKRKAENAGNYGSTRIASAIFSLEVACIVATTAILTLGHGITNSKYAMLALLLIVIATILVFFISLAISRKTIKHNIKSLALPAGAIAVMAICSVVMYTGGLGYTGYTPDAKDIKKIYVAGGYSTFSMDENNYYNNELVPLAWADTNISGVYESENDIKAALDMAGVISKRTNNMIRKTVYFNYELKDGSKITRRYTCVDKNAFKNILSLSNTEMFKDELKWLFTENGDTSPLNKMMEDDPMLSNYAYDDIDYQHNLIYGKAYIKSLDTFSEIEIDNTEELRAAILNDLLASDLQKRYTPDEKPLCMVRFYLSDLDEEDYIKDDEYYYDYYDMSMGYYVYPSMTNTVNYLKATGKLDDAQKITKLPDKAYVLKYTEAASYIDDTPLFKTGIASFVDEDDWMIYELDRLKEKNPLTVTGKDKLSKLMELSMPFGFIDNDTYIVIFEYTNDKAFLPMYIPAQDLPEWVKQSKSTDDVIGGADAKTIMVVK